MAENKIIIGASLGNCVHVAGIYRFLSLAEEYQYTSYFLGPAIPINQLIQCIKEKKPQRVIVGYRLSDNSARTLFTELRRQLDNNHLLDQSTFILSCTPALEPIAQSVGVFQYIFSGKESFDEILESIHQTPQDIPLDKKYPSTLPERILAKKPFPLLRHHFGRPSVEETIKGVAQISRSKTIDVISLGPDQNAQEFFFEPEKMKVDESGAGGVPIRSREDLERIYAASREGNYPLLRCYSGTNHLEDWAQLLYETIHIAWGAVPLTWYSRLDGRSQRSIQSAIAENQKAMQRYAALGVPLEVNESHQWSLRDAPDSVACAAFFLAAYNAKKVGAKHYIAQYMLNTPNGISPRADLAKMFAKKEFIAPLQDKDFTIYTQTRGGLAHFSTNMNIAKGQLGASTALGLVLKPDIIHVVGYSEADHLIYPHELIESAEIVQGVMKDLLFDFPDLEKDQVIQAEKKRLINEAKTLLEAIKNIQQPGDGDDPWVSPATLARAIQKGILDAPHLLGNPEACGHVRTRIINGILRIVDQSGKIIEEKDRLKNYLES
ncbi:MAG: methionine synthase [Candidatus Atribacteria bacterium]|nr:methionine synthase [Candidatus Atribacteria bacterium]